MNKKDDLVNKIEKVLMEEGIVDKLSKLKGKLSFSKMSEQELINTLKYNPSKPEGEQKILIMKRILNFVPPIFSLNDMNKEKAFKLGNIIDRMFLKHPFSILKNMDEDDFKRMVNIGRLSEGELQQAIEKILLEEGIMDRILRRKREEKKLSPEDLKKLKHGVSREQGRERWQKKVEGDRESNEMWDRFMGAEGSEERMNASSVMQKMFNFIPKTRMDRKSSLTLARTVSRMLAQNSYENLMQMGKDEFMQAAQKAAYNREQIQEQIENVIHNVLQEGIRGKFAGYSRGLKNWARDLSRDANIVNFGYELLPVVQKYRKDLDKLTNNFNKKFTPKYNKLKAKIKDAPTLQRFEKEVLPNKSALKTAVTHLIELEKELEAIKGYGKEPKPPKEDIGTRSRSAAAREKELDNQMQEDGFGDLARELNAKYKNNPSFRIASKKAIIGKSKSGGTNKTDSSGEEEEIPQQDEEEFFDDSQLNHKIRQLGKSSQIRKIDAEYETDEERIQAKKDLIQKLESGGEQEIEKPPAEVELDKKIEKAGKKASVEKIDKKYPQNQEKRTATKEDLATAFGISTKKEEPKMMTPEEEREKMTQAQKKRGFYRPVGDGGETKKKQVGSDDTTTTEPPKKTIKAQNPIKPTKKQSPQQKPEQEPLKKKIKRRGIKPEQKPNKNKKTLSPEELEAGWEKLLRQHTKKPRQQIGGWMKRK